jgi:hypothetical protein
VPADLTIASSSIEYVNVPVQATVAGTPYNPTADAVAMAFIAGPAQPTSFTSGSWITTVQGNYIARCLVGTNTNGILLAPGLYTVWVKITDSPEVPVRPAGTLQIT